MLLPAGQTRFLCWVVFVSKKTETKPQQKREEFNLSDNDEADKLFRKGLFQDALDKYTIKLNKVKDEKERVEILKKRGECHFQLRSFKEVIDDLSQVLAYNENDADALFKRGLAYENFEKFELAMKDMKKLQSLDPSRIQVTQAISRLNKILKMKEGFSW